jgi:RNA polymerase-interacting CarD/CdnL/TRCF family regulator
MGLRDIIDEKTLNDILKSIDKKSQDQQVNLQKIKEGKIDSISNNTLDITDNPSELLNCLPGLDLRKNKRN